MMKFEHSIHTELNFYFTVTLLSGYLLFKVKKFHDMSLTHGFKGNPI